jgi:hypothetical protein
MPAVSQAVVPPSTLAGAAHKVDRPRVPGVVGGDLLGVEPVERHVASEVDVDLAELGGGADVDEADRVAADAEVHELLGGDSCDHDE